MSNEEKIVNFTIRVEESLKKRFTSIAKLKDSDGSKEVRKFMKKYISDNAQLSMK